MKILAFSDIHGNLSYLRILEKKAANCDFLLCAGDISNFGIGLKKVLTALDKLGKKVFVIHGNHESIEEIEALHLRNIMTIHKKIINYNGLYLIGYGNLGFSERSADVEVFLKKIKTKVKNQKIIFMSHAPPRKTKVDYLEWLGHVGCNSLRKIMLSIKPVYYICGHLHENFGKTDKIKNTTIINPGPKGVIIKI